MNVKIPCWRRHVHWTRHSCVKRVGLSSVDAPKIGYSEGGVGAILRVIGDGFSKH